MTTTAPAHDSYESAADSRVEVVRTHGEKKSGYFVGAGYDSFFFLLPPLLALALGIMVSGSWLGTDEFSLWGNDGLTPQGLFIGAFIHAHLFAVFFRSHGNTTVRKTFPWRFFLVPVLLFAAMMSSTYVTVCVSVLATFWDVYHSGMQTFGLGRIYDRKAGNDANEGRWLDMILNQVLYAGPILAGATMMAHIEDFYEFNAVGDTFFTAIPAAMKGAQGTYAWIILGAGALFVCYYVYANWRAYKRGRNVSPQKVFLLASTGFVSIYSWGFNTWGEAFFIMNFFHALQYFGIVWASERKNLRKTLRLENLRFGGPLAWILFVGAVAAYGLSVELINGVHWFYALTLVVSIMHFWYDGFIWSVRKNQVQAPASSEAA